MTGFRPHKIAAVSATEGYEDSNGDWHPGESRPGDWMACHAVPAGAASEITLPDGTAFRYSYTVILDPGCEEFPIGTEVMLDLGWGVQSRYEVKGFHRYQLQSKVWV